MDPFDSLGGHYCLQTASEVKSDHRFEISDLDDLHILVDIAYMFWAHFVAFKASDLRFQMYGPNSICYNICLACFGLLLDK